MKRNVAFGVLPTEESLAARMEQYEVFATPLCVCGAYDEFASTPDNCLRGMQWSPDGLCLLTASDDKQLRLFEPSTVSSPRRMAATHPSALCLANG